ncbi:MAG: VOC family protein [Gammaproteobacteria bacterium]|nr:VOC family protein [Gammaproteobacteria bacterium]
MTAEPTILALHHVSILVADTARARRFYEDVLGLKPLDRPDLGFTGAWLALGKSQQLHLMELPTPDPRTGRPEHGGRDRHFALCVADLTPFIQRLEQAGIPYTRSRSGRPSIFFRDPDGTAVELMGGDPPIL